ncbi:MAG: DUF6263 family protein [Chitinophagaceae bacterium]
MFCNRLLPGLLIVLTVIVSCRDAQNTSGNTWIFNPAIDASYHFTIKEEEALGGVDSVSDVVSSQVEWALQCVAKDDSLRTMKLLIGPYVINRQGINYSTAEKKWEKPVLSGFSGAAYSALLIYYTQYVVGDSLLITIDRKGKVLRVKGFERIVDTVTSLTQEDRRTVRAYLREFIGTESMQDRLTQLFQYLPGSEIKTGDNWISNMVLIARAPVKYSNLLTVKDVRNDSVILDVKAAISASTGEGGRVYAQGARKGAAVISNSTGVLYSCALLDSVTTNTDSQVYRRIRKLTIKRS